MVRADIKHDAEVSGLSECCGADIVNGFCEACLEHAEPCEFCQGTGKIERIEVVCDDSTGYNRVEHGTGVFDRCFNCNADDTDMDDDS